MVVGSVAVGLVAAVDCSRQDAPQIAHWFARHEQCMHFCAAVLQLEAGQRSACLGGGEELGGGGGELQSAKNGRSLSRTCR